MTTETNTAFEGFKDAFKNIQNLEVPEAAREFVKKTANTAKDRAAEVFAGSERVTAAVENAVTESVTEAGKISRNIQQAIYEDAEAVLLGHRQARVREVDQRSRRDPVEPAPRPRRSLRLARQGDRRLCRQARCQRCEVRSGQFCQGLHQDRLIRHPEYN
ncbi:hypothetical protein ABIG04_008286 [Bradyrhizobium japonicum]